MDRGREEEVQEEIESRVREGVKALIEQILEEEMAERGRGGYQRSVAHRGERNGRYERDLTSGVGQIRQLQVPCDRDGTFRTELFQRYRLLIGSVEEGLLAMYLQGVSTPKVAVRSPQFFRASGWEKS